jgi:hypothetical protein
MPSQLQLIDLLFKSCWNLVIVHPIGHVRICGTYKCQILVAESYRSLPAFDGSLPYFSGSTTSALVHSPDGISHRAYSSWDSPDPYFAHQDTSSALFGPQAPPTQLHSPASINYSQHSQWNNPSFVSSPDAMAPYVSKLLFESMTQSSHITSFSLTIYKNDLWSVTARITANNQTINPNTNTHRIIRFTTILNTLASYCFRYPASTPYPGPKSCSR